MTRLLETHDLVAGHRGVPAVKGLNVHVDAGEVVALLGANGAGKSTTLRTLVGALPIISGDAVVLGSTIRGHAVHSIARRGVAMLPDDSGLCFRLTGFENLRLHRHRGSVVTVAEALEAFPALHGRLDRRAGLLSGGEQQMLALACQLVSDPKLLIIDELSLGLAPIIVESLMPIVAAIAHERSVGVLLVEQQVPVALAVADRAYVMSRGSVVLDDTADRLRGRRDLVEASYLGDSVSEGA